MYMKRKGIKDRMCQSNTTNACKAELVAELEAAEEVEVVIEVAVLLLPEEEVVGLPECG